MAIKDLKLDVDLSNDYETFKKFISTAAYYAQQALEIKIRLQENPLFIPDADQAEKDYITAANLVCDNFNRAIPIPPDETLP